MLKTPVVGRRLDILEWLKDPALHFPPGPPGGRAAVPGVTAEEIAAKLGTPLATANVHLDFLTRLGLLHTERLGAHTYYRRDEIRIAEVARLFEKGWHP